MNWPEAMMAATAALWPHVFERPVLIEAESEPSGFRLEAAAVNTV